MLLLQLLLTVVQISKMHNTLYNSVDTFPFNNTVNTLVKGPVVSLSKKLNPYCLVLVGSTIKLK